jgi:peptide deformylase
MSVDPASLHIVEYPHPVLRQKATGVESVTDEIRGVAARMVDLMNESDGLGLAAPQVALPWRMFVTVVNLPRAEADEEAGQVLKDGEHHEVSGEPEDLINGLPGRVFINPEVVVNDPAMITHEEGCLSIPGIHVDIRRPRAVTIRALDIHGESFEISSDNFFARVWQHEFDHLNGVLIIDRMSKLDRLATRKQLKELETATG